MVLKENVKKESGPALTLRLPGMPNPRNLGTGISAQFSRIHIYVAVSVQILFLRVTWKYLFTHFIWQGHPKCNLSRLYLSLISLLNSMTNPWSKALYGLAAIILSIVAVLSEPIPTSSISAVHYNYISHMYN